MIWTIARKEIISNLLSYKFFVVILLTLLLILSSFFIMYRDYKLRLADYQLIKPISEEPIAVIPPNPLSIFARGLEDIMNRSYEINRVGINVRAGQQSGNIIFLFFPSPDLIYIVRVVLSLVALLFGFDQVNREKEAGTLRLILSNSVSRANVLLGKWFGNFLSLSAPFLLVVFLGIVLMNLDPGIHFSSNNIVCLVFLILLTLIYFAFFLSLGILISALTRRTASSLVILLFIWTLLVFVIPNLGTLLARQMVDVPPIKTMTEKREQIWTREILLLQMERNARNDMGVAPIIKKHFDTINRELDQLEENYWNKFNRMVMLSKNINRISPVASFVYAATEIAGTGVGEASNLKREVIKHKDLIIIDFERDKKEHPVFQYRYRSFGQIFAEGSLFDVAWIICLNIIFFVLSYFVFVRYDVR